MIRPLFIALLIALFAVVGPQSAVAQEDLSEETSVAEDADSWARIAERAETLAARDDASAFAISRVRAELVVWRDHFLRQSNLNAARIATVESQLAALGPTAEGVEDPPDVAARRAELQAQHDALLAPRLLAQEAYARANGLIGELDVQVLQRQTAALTDRGPSPLNPAHLMSAVAAFWSLTEIIWVETTAGFSTHLNSGALARALPRAALFFAVGVGLVGIGRRTVTRWRAALAKRDGNWLPLWLFGLSMVQIIVPVIGFLLVTEGLQSLSIFGVRGTDVVESIPGTGFVVIFGWWLARHIFPVGERPGYLGYAAQTRAAGRRYTLTIAWVIAVGRMFDAGFQTMEITEGTAAAIEWPVLALLGILFWRLGRVIKTPPMAQDGAAVSSGLLRGLVGQLCTIVAVAGPLVAAFGYAAAGRGLLIPSIMSLALIGMILILQRIVHDMTKPVEHDESGKGLVALLPVFVSFGLYMCSLPIFALIWGARTDDLNEIWTRFREGFAVGETRISPTDFLTFVMVFAIGYVLTRFIQGTLRRSVMPRTRLDLGGQNAILAGFGYIGIIVSAILAITTAGIDLSSLAIVAGALSVGIGFGLQNIVSNFVSGIILLIERPVSEGDWIEVGGRMGYVRSISVRSTRIETFDRTDVIIPNADLVSGQVINWTRGNLIGRVIVPVGVAYGTDVEKVTAILQGIAEAHPLVLVTPPPTVIFAGFGADSLDFEIRAILRDVNFVLLTKSEMNYEIVKQFAEAGIEIPFAQRDIWLRNPEVLKGMT